MTNLTLKSVQLTLEPQCHYGSGVATLFNGEGDGFLSMLPTTLRARLEKCCVLAAGDKRTPDSNGVAGAAPVEKEPSKKRVKEKEVEKSVKEQKVSAKDDKSA
jgi:hypothetical protein